jgi:hypothetical protein
MVDWKTPKEIEAEGSECRAEFLGISYSDHFVLVVAFTKAVYVLFGVYIWEICTTGRFEVSIFLGRRKLAWPLVRFPLIYDRG